MIVFRLFNQLLVLVLPGEEGMVFLRNVLTTFISSRRLEPSKVIKSRSFHRFISRNGCHVLLSKVSSCDFKIYSGHPRYQKMVTNFYVGHKRESGSIRHKVVGDQRLE